jgi:hypothetical protein
MLLANFLEKQKIRAEHFGVFLKNMVDSRRKSVLENPPECGVFETSVEESVEWNQLGNFGQDRKQFSKAPEGLYWRKRWPFWIDLVALLL